MSSLNTVLLLGNLTRDVDLSYTPSGKPVAKASLAVSNKYMDKDKKEIDKPLFIDIVIWNKQAESTAEYMHKGDQMFVQGRLELDQWTDKEGGKHKKIKVVASKIIFGQKRKSQLESISNNDDGLPPPDTDADELITSAESELLNA
jgi:single-strand DNA-binding protein